MSSMNFIVYCAIFVVGKGIYVPPEETTVSRLGHAGIKTLNWQSSNQERSPSLTVHHNYSRVYQHPSIANSSYTSIYTHHTNGASPAYSDQTANGPNPQLEIEPQQNLIQQNSPESTPKIPDDSRPFTNAHSGGYPLPKPEKLRQAIRIKPQQSRYPREKLEVLKTCPPSATGQFVYELSCNQFLNCWKGHGFVQNCAPGTLFNPRTLECDFKDKVVCVSGPRQAALKEREPISQALQAKCPAGFSGIIPHYSDCSKFITCNNGAEISMDCAPGTLFDIKSNMCDYPYKALCVGSDDIKVGRDGRPIQTDSGKLVVIQGYKSNISYEIPSRNINDHLQGFDRYENGGSDNRRGKGRFGINDHLGEFSNINSTSGIHQQWNQRNEWFRVTPLYIGLTKTPKPQGHRQESIQHPQTPKCPEGASGLFPHPSICEKFLNCDHGRTFIQDCGPGTVFNPKFKVCDFPYNVDCQNETTIEVEPEPNFYQGGTATNAQNYKMIAALNEAYSMGLDEGYCRNRIGFSIYPKNCSRFLYCDGGKLFIGICSGDTSFNPTKEDCEEDVDCAWFVSQYEGESGTILENGSREKWQVNTQYQHFRLVDIGYEGHILGLDNGFCRSNLGFSTHPNNCSKFLLCSNERLLLGICNPKKFYNPTTKTCDYNSNCVHTIQPQYGGTNQQGGIGGSGAPQEDWQVNTQYQHFRLVDIGNEGYILGLDNGFCRSNLGFSTHPNNCSKFLLCSNGRLLLGICNPNKFYNPTTKTCDYNSNCAHTIQPQYGGSNQQGGIGGSGSSQEDWQVNKPYQNFQLFDIGNEAHNLGLDNGFCQVNLGFSIHPKNCSKFLLCLDGRLLLGICNSNKFYNPTAKTCDYNSNCAHIIQPQPQYGGSNQQGGSTGSGWPQENWQVNTQYQHFRLVNMGYEGNALSLNNKFCENNPGFSPHPNNCSKFLLCLNSRLLLGICNPNKFYNPTAKTCDYNSNCAHIIQPQPQYGGRNQQGGSTGSDWLQENWQVNTQYQHFRLVKMGYEGNALSLNNKYCESNPGFSLHPNNCSKFLLCVNGRLLLGICNPNKFYNPTAKTCDYNSNCAHSIQPQPQYGGSNQQGGIGGSGSPQEDWQVNTQYQHFRLVDIGNEGHILGLDNGFCRSNLGFSTHPTNCSKFLLCSNGRLLLGICNPNKFYNPTTKTCDYNSNCAPIIQPQQHGGSNQQGGIGGSGSSQEDWQVNTQYPNFRLVDIGNEGYVLGLDNRFCQVNLGFSIHPTNCSKFLLCVKGRLFLGVCNPNKFYNPTAKTCDYNSKCGHIIQSQYAGSNQQGGWSQDQWKVNQQYRDFRLVEAGNEMNVLGLDLFYCRDNDGFTTHPKNCSRFLLCQNGRLMLGICHPQKSFNPSSKTCELNYNCGFGYGRVEGDVEISNQQDPQWENLEFGIYTTIDEVGNYCKINNGFSEHPTNCSKFFYCKNDRLYLGVCKLNRLYNQTLRTCDYSSTCRRGQHGSMDLINCQSKPDGLYPHPTLCSKFVNCENNKAKIHNCAPGTVFSSISKMCGFPHNVDCTDRLGIDDKLDFTLENQGQGYWDQNQSNQWQDQFNQNTNNQWEDQWNQNNQNWQDQFNQNQNNEDWTGNQWNQNQNQQNNQWTDQIGLTTQIPIGRILDEDRDAIVVTYDQNKKPTNNWPPPFPTTDPNADYVFEINDLVEVNVPDKPLKEICQETDFRCTKTTCIDHRRVCDGSVDCPDGEDEKNCEKYIEEFTHITSTKMAVKEKVKYDNITATLCAKNCIESKGFTCKAFNFRKIDGACFLLTTNVGLSGSLFILPTYDYYEYALYSIECEYKCTNQKCVQEHQICDGIDDCVDRYDEKGCTAQELGYSARLVGAGKKYEGAVEITALGKTGYVCDDMFNMDAANILCKELGFHLGAADFKGNSYFAQNLTKNETFFMMDDVVCDGKEASIKDCDFRGWGISNCIEKEVVGVTCKTPEELCTAEMWQCETVDECVPLTFVCDGVEDDCSDNSDEASQYCDAPIEMRLVGGQRETEGRVEIKYHGTWGTICDDDFNDDAGKVICKFLGYPGPAHVMKEAHFGQGSGPIWLDQVFCHGNESTLNDCIKWDWGVNNCDHSEDVGVICADYENAGSPRNLDQNEVEHILESNRCGYRNDDIFLDNTDVHFRVIKGSMAEKGQYPWQASLRVKGRNTSSHWCGGVVISEKFVLTAAHCLHGVTKGAYVVVAGDYDANEHEGTEQQIYIDEFYIHEEFRQGTKMNNDIALIRLKGGGFNITRDVQPICLPDANFNDEAGMNCTISGFGSVRSGKAVASKELRAGWIPIQPSEVCKMPHVYGKTITEGMICAGSLDGGVDACDGDSGGPLACLYDGLFTLVGMTSWGQHCGEANKPGVYVKIAHYRNWIDETMKRHYG